MKKIFVLIATMGMNAVLYIFKGYVLSVMWYWFMVPIFSLPKLTIVPSIAVIVVVNLLTFRYRYVSEEEDGKSDLARSLTIFIHGIIYTAVSLLAGWIVHIYM